MIDKKIVLKEVFVADTFFSRLLGYMFQKTPHHNGIYFKPCNSIHTFFMRFDIDVLFLDANYQVIKRVNCMGKGKIIKPIAKANIVLESYAGAFSKVNIGDVLEFL